MSNKVMSNLSVGLFGDVSDFAHKFGHEAKDAAKGFGDSLKETGSKALELTGIAGMVGVAFEAVMDIAKGFKLAAEFDKASVSLGAFIGNSEQAKEVLTQLKEFGVRSPFEFGDLAKTAQKLSAFGVEAKQLVPTINMLGNIAAGTGGNVNELAEMYIRVQENGVLAGREIREFTNAGIPLTAALAKSLGKTPQQIHQMGEAGRITFPMVQKAFIGMTSQGGAFNNMLQKQAGTMSGLWSSVTHTVDDDLEKIAASFSKGFGAGGEQGEKLISVLNTIGDVFSKLAFYFGKGLDVIAFAFQYVSDKAHAFLDTFDSARQAMEWLKANGWLDGGDVKNGVIPAPKIDGKLSPMSLEVHPHMDKTPLIKWGSAEMSRIQQEWAGQFPKVVAKKPEQAPGTVPLTGAQVNAMKGGFEAAKKGKFEDYIKQIMSNVVFIHNGKDLNEQRRLSTLNSTTSSGDTENTWVDSHGVRHRQSDTPDHAQNWFGRAGTAVLPRVVPDPDAKSGAGKRAWDELGKSREQAKQDMYKANDYLYKIWQQGQNIQTVSIVGQ